MALVRTNDMCAHCQSFGQPEGSAEDCIKGVSWEGGGGVIGRGSVGGKIGRGSVGGGE